MQRHELILGADVAILLKFLIFDNKSVVKIGEIREYWQHSTKFDKFRRCTPFANCHILVKMLYKSSKKAKMYNIANWRGWTFWFDWDFRQNSTNFDTRGSDTQGSENKGDTRGSDTQGETKTREQHLREATPKGDDTCDPTEQVDLAESQTTTTVAPQPKPLPTPTKNPANTY